MKTAAIDDLIEATFDPNSNKRKAATRELCPCEIKAYVPEMWDRLLALAEDSDDDVRRITLHTFIDGSPKQREDDVAEAIRKMQWDRNPKISRQAKAVYARYLRTGRINHDAT